MLPISLQDQLVPGTLEHTISQLVDKHIDLSVFEGRYNNDETGATAIHPSNPTQSHSACLLQGDNQFPSNRAGLPGKHHFHCPNLWLYPWSQHHCSIYLFDANRDPDHLQQYSPGVRGTGLLNGTHYFSLDGVKLPANVSKEWSGTIDELKHKRDKLQDKLQRVLAEHAQADKQPELELERQKKRERRFQLQWND